MSPQPVRITRSRVKGSKLTSPNGLPVVCVTRGTKWGNPFTINDWHASIPVAKRKQFALNEFRKALLSDANEWRSVKFTVADVKRELRGKNLACFCKESPCHADVLLEIANG